MLTSACSAATPADRSGISSGRDAVLDRIERDARLPSGAAPLSTYARYYAADDDGGVAAVYLLAVDSDHHSQPYDLAAGRRRWISGGQRNLPRILDGGCGVIELRADAQGTITQPPRCNAEA